MQVGQRQEDSQALENHFGGEADLVEEMPSYEPKSVASSQGVCSLASIQCQKANQKKKN